MCKLFNCGLIQVSRVRKQGDREEKPIQDVLMSDLPSGQLEFNFTGHPQSNGAECNLELSL